MDELLRACWTLPWRFFLYLSISVCMDLFSQGDITVFFSLSSFGLRIVCTMVLELAAKMAYEEKVDKRKQKELSRRLPRHGRGAERRGEERAGGDRRGCCKLCVRSGPCF